MHKDKDFKGIVTRWHGKGFGEALVASLFCHILNDNGIPSVHREHRNSWGLLDVPLYDPELHSDWTLWHWGYRRSKIPSLMQQIYRVEKWLGVNIKINRRKFNHIPVKFEKMPVEKYEVVINSRTGTHTPYKEWSYFCELYKLFKKAKISYLDLDMHNKYGMECLNLVKRAKIFLGLDTGMSHYVSRFARGKALIIHGGFVTFDFWAFLYNYEPIQIEDVPCRPCYITRWHIENDKQECEQYHRCLAEISPEMVFDRVCERLGL